MLTKKMAGRSKAIMGMMLLLCLVSGFQVQAMPVWDPAPGALSDSLSEQERDSLIFRLNLQYLNRVNEHGTPYELISIIENILKLDSSFHNHWFNLGLENIKIKEYDRALEALNRGLELYPDKDNASLVQIYISISFCYHQTQRYQQEIVVLDSASQLFPDHAGITGRYMINSHARVRYTEADYYRNKLILILRSFPCEMASRGCQCRPGKRAVVGLRSMLSCTRAPCRPTK